MGKPAATISNFHVCPKTTGQVPHVGGPVIQGSTDVFIGGLPAARVGDALICVGPPDKIKEGSASVFINGKPAARLGDGTNHGGVIVVGNPTVTIGDRCPPSTPRGPNGVFVDAGSQSKLKEPWRKPQVDGNKVAIYGQPQATATIINAHKAGTEESIESPSGQVVTVRRDEAGFPQFTIYETVLPDSAIGTGRRDGHFKEANRALGAALIDDPGLAGAMGLSDEQVAFLTKHPPSPRCPPDLTWHHHQDVCRMQLVQQEQHDLFRHTGGMKIWGGGND